MTSSGKAPMRTKHGHVLTTREGLFSLKLHAVHSLILSVLLCFRISYAFRSGFLFCCSLLRDLFRSRTSPALSTPRGSFSSLVSFLHCC
ncbi:hypothetical protein LDENG_00163410 [Lucifuga dentata]|nr:hypothetical protein LDENG_00163410 [Lucifuga dentata]